MLNEQDKDLDKKFLRCLSVIKDWEYHEKIEAEKKTEIKDFISLYVFKKEYGGILKNGVSYNRLKFLVEHPAFRPAIKALLLLMETSNNEIEFNDRYQKATL
jgi:hypothetical protein